MIKFRVKIRETKQRNRWSRYSINIPKEKVDEFNLKANLEYNVILEPIAEQKCEFCNSIEEIMTVVKDKKRHLVCFKCLTDSEYRKSKDVVIKWLEKKKKENAGGV